MNWKRADKLLVSARNVSMKIVHADFGNIDKFSGNNTLPQNRLYLCADNTGEIQWRSAGGADMELPLKANHVYFMPRNIDLHFNFTGGRMVAVHFNLEIISGYDIYTLETECRELPVERKFVLELISLLDNISGLSQIFAAQAMIMKTASRFCRLDSNAMQRQELLRNKYNKLLLLLDKNLNAKTSVASLAKNLNVSRDHLSKGFSRDFGIPLKKYLCHRLIDKASHLLTGGETLVNEASYELGFSSEFYFSRFFSKHTGMPPSEYRQKYGKRRTTI